VNKMKRENFSLFVISYGLCASIFSGGGIYFCEVRYRVSMIEPTSLIRETDAVIMPVHSFIVKEMPKATAL
jgi:hypothetical protein